MPKHPTLLQHFRSFCYQNAATDFDKAVTYFAVFGGMGWDIDLSRPLEVLIEEKVLANYRYIHGDITAITQSNPVYHALLSALARGDRREHSAFKRANLGREKGEDAIDFLVDEGMLKIDTSIEKPVDSADDNSDKLLFEQPFMRFWFSSVSPYYKGIKEGDYREVKEHWSHLAHGFSNHLYTQLVMEVIKTGFLEEDTIDRVGSYWDRNVEIDILARKKSGGMIAGLCKYSKSKANKNDLNRLMTLCEKAELDIDTYVIFSQNKFSTELKKEKGTKLRLLSPRNMTCLMDDLCSEDQLGVFSQKVLRIPWLRSDGIMVYYYYMIVDLSYRMNKRLMYVIKCIVTGMRCVFASFFK